MLESDLGWKFARTNLSHVQLRCGEEKTRQLFIYIRVALGNGRTDASSVVYVRRTPSELPSARDGQTCRLTYIHGPWSRRPEESERARETYRTHAPQNTSLLPTTHSQPKHLFLV